MEGMIWNANHVLDTALDPKTPGVPRQILAHCKGIVLISVVEVGFIFSGSVGTGVILAQNDDGVWSPPSAVGLTGVGFGLLVGADVKDILILLVDDRAIEALSGEHQIKFGSQLGIAAGPIGREIGGDLHFSLERSDIALSYSFSKGLFVGINLEGAVLGARDKVNKKFYGKECKPKDILFERNVTIPEDDAGIAELHKKLDLLKEGKTSELTDEELVKKEDLRKSAQEKAEVAKKEQPEEIVHVDAAEEAKKEQAATEAPKEEAVQEHAKDPPAEEHAKPDV